MAFIGNQIITINSLLDLDGQELVLDADADSTIHVSTDDQIDFKIGGTDVMAMSTTGLTITNATNDAQLILKSTDDDANGGPLLDLTRDSASPADNDAMGSIRFRADDDGGNEQQFVDITAVATDVTNGNEDAKITIRTIKAGTLTDTLVLESGNTTVSGNATVSGTLEKTVANTSTNGGIAVNNGSYDAVAIGTGGYSINGGTATDGGIRAYNNLLFGSGSSSTERMRITSGGELLLGTTTAPSGGSVHMVINSSSGGGIQLTRNNNGGSVIDAIDGGGARFFSFTGAVGSESYTERMRINDDGSLFINHASNTHPIVGTEKLGVVGGTGSTAVAIACNAGNATGVGLFVGSTPDGAVDFVKFSSGSGGDTRGLIEFDGSNMTYGGTSDYRLKENVATYTKGIETLKKLNPIAFTWKESKASDVGFLAHEVAEIHPNAVSGDKDGMETVAGVEKIRPQMLDPSKLVGILTAALQEAMARIETLEAKVATLESK